MNTLSSSAYDKAVSALDQGARPLEKALYAYYFNGAPGADVLSELAGFQNADGGFGHGLEPDIRLKDSSVIATTIAFQRLREINAAPDHPLVVNACRFLLNTYRADDLNWAIIPDNIDDAPHAPWWVHSGDLEHSRSNPRAEIAGYLLDYADHFPKAMRDAVLQSVTDFLLEQPDQLEMHDLLCYLRLSETNALPNASRTAINDKLSRVVQNIVERDPEGWKSYGLQPLAVISSPDSPFAASFRDEIPLNLDFIIDSQGEDGTWGPNWTWGEPSTDAWEQARRDWTGVITLDNLRKLRAFGRISG